MRQWAFWASVSHSRILARQPKTGAVWFGLPRHTYRKVLRAPIELLKSAVCGSHADAFNHELTLWRFAGLFYGTHRFRPEAALNSDDG